MKICIFTDSYFPFISGVTTTIFNQSHELAKRGHKIYILCITHKKDIKKLKKVHKNITIENLPFSFPVPVYKGFNIALPSIIKSAHIIKKFKPDILHAHTEFGIGWEGLICSRIFKLPIVGTFHTFFADPGYLKLLKANNVKILQKIIWKNSVLFFNHCNKVISPSKKTKSELKKYGVESPLITINNGIKLPHLISKKELSKHSKKYFLTKKKLRLIYVGRIGVEKSLDIVLKALKNVLSLGKKAEFILIGDGPYLKNIKNIAKELEIENSVKYLGRINHDILIKKNLFRLGDVFITAGKTENQPVSIVEALAFGLPIIGVNKRGIPELIDHNKTGFISKADDHKEMAKNIIKYIDSPSLLKTMSKNALKKAKEHDISRTGEKLEELYIECIKENKKLNKPKYKFKDLKQKTKEKFHSIKTKFEEFA